MKVIERRWTYLLIDDWTWWAWAAIAILLTFGLSGYPRCFIAALGVSTAQLLIMFIREQTLLAFPVQLRIAYTALLLLCLLPGMHWLFWLPTLGTFALILFGYCLLARVLSLLPWNRHEPISFDLLARTFFSPPSLPATTPHHPGFGCAGGLCTIEAQVRHTK